MYIAGFDRKIDYLRISVTDRCNLRCNYCMPQIGIINKPHEELLTFEEIQRVVRIFASLGISKVRLTGGEPLVRKGAVNLVKSLAEIEEIEDLCLTTNGTLLPLYAERLKEASLKRINISLDTLNENKFRKITRGGSIYKVLEGIDRAKQANFYPLKLNMVVMKGINDDEITDFVDFAFSKGLILRFIEFMNVTPLWREDYFIPIEEVKKNCEKRFRLRRIEDSGPGPAVYYEDENKNVLGFICTSVDNCRICNRLRLSSTGELKICLYETQGICLKSLLREDFSDEEMRNIIKTRVKIKENTGYQYWEANRVYMSSIGG